MWCFRSDRSRMRPGTAAWKTTISTLTHPTLIQISPYLPARTRLLAYSTYPMTHMSTQTWRGSTLTSPRSCWWYSKDSMWSTTFLFNLRKSIARNSVVCSPVLTILSPHTPHIVQTSQAWKKQRVVKTFFFP